MKVFQTIYTSAVTTLENRQGLGRVFCSKDLPEPIREKIAHYEYDSDAGGSPIYCFERLDCSGEKWLLLNKAVPAVDYTGRTSCVSHTLAFRQADLLAMLESWTGPIPTVFEFAKNFKWTTTWQGDPKWETEAEILTLQKAFESVRPTGQIADQDRSPAPLLVFNCGEDGIPKPKCGAWKFSVQTPDEILDQFNRVWLCVDPWSGTRKYGNHLGEPDMGRVSSWDCTFATNLRNNSPTPYEWVVLSPKVPQMPSRETLEPASWGALGVDEIKAKTAANGMPNLLVERIQEGAENWAQRRLREILEELGKTYSKQIENSNQESGRKAQIALRQMKDEVAKDEAKFEEALASEWVVFGPAKQETLTSLEADLRRNRENASRNSGGLLLEYEEKTAQIRALMRFQASVAQDAPGAIRLFDEEFGEFDRLRKQWQEQAPWAHLYEFAKECEVSYEDKKRLAADLTDEKNRLSKDLTSAKLVNDGLSSQLRIASKSKAVKDKSSISLLVVTLGFVIIVLVGLIFWMAYKEPKPKIDDPHAISNLNQKIDVLIAKNNSLTDRNSELININDELKKWNGSLNDEGATLKQGVKKQNVETKGSEGSLKPEEQKSDLNSSDASKDAPGGGVPSSDHARPASTSKSIKDNPE